MNILVIGSGGREHALCWKIAKSPRCTKLFCAPGNGGISQIAQIVDIAADNVDKLLDFAKANKIDLTVVGPEAPLVKGIVDKFNAAGLKIFGPAKDLAQIEGSKVFSKELMKRLGVPTAAFEVFTRAGDAMKYLESRKTPLVIKADGLAAGKGVVVCKYMDEAKQAVKSMMVERVFAAAADKVIIEDCLTGEEASVIVVSDGKDFVPMASSQDHKRAYDGDKGPNTGGMGAYSPAPVVTDALYKTISDTAMAPIINELAKQGRPYKGVLYAGVMVTDMGPFVLEFNARFGDPETQAIMPRLKTDLVDIMLASIEGRLSGIKLDWDKRPCVSVVMASGGYPGEYEKGADIRGLEEANAMPDTVVFHAGTKLGKRVTDGRNTFITCGGRVLNVTALGKTYKEAADNCYKAAGKINFEKAHYRRDIAWRAIK